MEGAFQHKGQFGFVLSEDPLIGDVLVQGPSLRLAMGGDRVRARVLSAPSETRRSGEIVEVLTRARETAVGTFKRLGPMAVLSTQADETQIRILDLKGFSPRVGDLAVVRITRWPTLKEPAAGQLTEVLGSRDTPGVDLAAVIRQYELPQRFPPAAEREADAFGTEVPEDAWRAPGRELFFDQRVFTIDGADAKDFDDAVSLEPLADGWRLGVHIADVAQYVREGSVLDHEARRRGTSVYFTGSVLPMLPSPLSDGLCSLRPDVVRLTVSCVMEIDRDGRVRRERVVESAIRSARRFTYDEVETILTGGNLPGLDSAILSDVREMGRLARLLREKRFARGSLDFDFPEPEVITDLDGRPIDIRRRARLEAHRLIEDFMLLANETVARTMRQQPFLYRIHETPDPARMEKLKKSLEGVGIRLPQDKDPSHPSALSAVLAASEGTPLQPLVHLMVLRNLKQAMYSPVNKGHYGLASECYTHFTSPIRRYPDLIVHRLLKERLRGSERRDHWTSALPGLCEHASKRERVAVDAEREFLDIQKTRLMEPHVGEIFNGVISTVTNFGFFVQLDEFFVEGLVHVSHLGRDYFIFDEFRMTLVGRRTGRVFAVGQKVKVRLAAANILKHQLDLELLSDKAVGRTPHPKSQKPPHPPRSHARR
ncbi:MAG: ribonuclease R [Elusimicrobia bacterium]|nr:ribonuclease R [Candidatus Obscuribacterium magneticum]